MILPVISPGVRGVDLSRSPFLLRATAARYSINLTYTNSGIRTRPGFVYDSLGISGKFQGATVFRPARGMSAMRFSEDMAVLVTAADNKLFANGTDNSGVHGCPIVLKEVGDPCKTYQTQLASVDLFPAENYLIIQGTGRQTAWWDATSDSVTLSPGMEEQDRSLTDDGCTSSHDTFKWELHRNFLVNGASVGIFTHGRVHQAHGRLIYVGDPINKRGYLKTDDVLLMEEQRLPSFGPPLNITSSLGYVRAMVVTPRVGNTASAYGQGELVVYCEGGVVSFNTNLPGRRRKISGDGEIITEGWEGKRMVDPLCNVITATGRYAAAALPRDQMFRSTFGVHILSQVLGVEVLNDEPVHTISGPVDPLLRTDREDLLDGVATGYWLRGNRFVCTTLMREGCNHSTTSVGEGFVVYNKAFDRTVDGTPLPCWEGLWTPAPKTVTTLHRFVSLGVTPDSPGYGFIASTDERALYYGALTSNMPHDFFEGKEYEIPWLYESGRFWTGDTLGVISDAHIDATLLTLSSRFTIEVRTDQQQEWQTWFEVSAESSGAELTDFPVDCGLKVGLSCGSPSVGEGAWFQFRLRGVGAVELTAFSVDLAAGQAKNTGNSLAAVPLLDPIPLEP